MKIIVNYPSIDDLICDECKKNSKALFSNLSFSYRRALMGQICGKCASLFLERNIHEVQEELANAIKELESIKLSNLKDKK